MTNYMTNDEELTSVANAIRAKGGTSGALEYPTGFVSAVQSIPTGGGSARTCTVIITDDPPDLVCSGFSGGEPSGGFAAVFRLSSDDGDTVAAFLSRNGCTTFTEAGAENTSCVLALADSMAVGEVGFVSSTTASAFVINDTPNGEYSSLLPYYVGVYQATVVEL